MKKFLDSLLAQVGSSAPAKNTVVIAIVIGMVPPAFAAKNAKIPWDCAVNRSTLAKAQSKLKPQEVIRLASVAAQKEGILLAKFEQSSICFAATAKSGQWTVFFEGREPRPGNHFLVWVQDDTGATRYMHGE